MANQKWDDVWFRLVVPSKAVAEQDGFPGALVASPSTASGADLGDGWLLQFAPASKTKCPRIGTAKHATYKMVARPEGATKREVADAYVAAREAVGKPLPKERQSDIEWLASYLQPSFALEEQGYGMATRGSATEGNVDLSSSPHATQNKRESRWAELAEALCLPADWLDVLEELLRDKRQLVLYGPPGTGKTYIAKRFAQAFAGDAEQVRIVQFHPAYSYEDFVEGYRPREDGGFSLVSGPLMDSAEAAREDPEHPYVLVIDELNRGNLAKVLGELYLLLEYREEAVRLLYSRNEFTLPKNLFFIGTMNTADRSIALIDAALRRRFHFLPLFPDRAPIEGLLRRWLARNKPEHLWVAEALDSANTKLMDRHFAIGPSHFLRSDLDERKIELVWRHSVVPYIEEHFFDDQNRVAEFELDRIRGEGPGSSLTSSGVADKNGKASDGTNNPAD